MARGDTINPIQSIGIYTCYTGLPAEQIDFFAACGYNTYQRWDMGWSIGPAKHERYYAELAADVRRMQQAGFRVYVLLSVNMVQRRDGEPEGYRDAGFDPTDAAMMRERLDYLAATVQKLSFADGFTIFAGDPGGHRNSTPEQAFESARQVMAVVRQCAPAAENNVNPWGIAAWDKFTSPFEVAFWQKEVSITRRLLAEPDLLGPRCGIEFPLHNYYRSLALDCHARSGAAPELFPVRRETDALRQRGVARLWGWPYFLTDECDDGYGGRTAGTTQGETRYLKSCIDAARWLGLDGMVANAFAANIPAEALNLYAFARFCREPDATPATVIRDFVGLLAEPESAADLASILQFVENHSTWEAGLPAQHRLPPFPLDKPGSADVALAMLDAVRLLPAARQPFTEAPAAYGQRLRHRLGQLAAPAGSNP